MKRLNRENFSMEDSLGGGGKRERERERTNNLSTYDTAVSI